MRTWYVLILFTFFCEFWRNVGFFFNRWVEFPIRCLGFKGMFTRRILYFFSSWRRRTWQSLQLIRKIVIVICRCSFQSVWTWYVFVSFFGCRRWRGRLNRSSGRLRFCLFGRTIFLVIFCFIIKFKRWWLVLSFRRTESVWTFREIFGSIKWFIVAHEILRFILLFERNMLFRMAFRWANFMWFVEMIISGLSF